MNISNTLAPTAQLNGLKLMWLLSVILAFFFNIQAIPLFDLDEGAFGQTTLEMFQRDDFLTLSLNGEPRTDKPILTHWVQALSVHILGVSELSLRLPSALAATLWNLLLVGFTWRFTSPRTALIAGLLMSGCIGIGLIGKAATADALTNLFLSGTLFSLYLTLTENKSRYLFAAACFAGLGFLTKGPIALLIPGVVSLLFALWTHRTGAWLRMLSNPWAWLIFVSVGLPWYLINYLKEGPEFIEAFVGIHNLGRFVAPMEGHRGHWWYYLPVFFLITFPFGPILVRPFRRFRSLFASSLERFLIVWFLFVLVFFSFSATKLPHYLIYGITPLFLLAAKHLDSTFSLKPVFLPLIALIVLLLGLPQLIPYLATRVETPKLSEILNQTDHVVIGDMNLALLLILAVCIGLLMDHRLPKTGKLLSAGLLSTFLASQILAPLIARIQQEPIHQAGMIAARYQEPAVMWCLNTPSFSVYAGRATPKRAPEPGELVFTKRRYLTKLPAHEVLYSQQGFVLAMIHPEEKFHVSANPSPPQSGTDLGGTDSGTDRAVDGSAVAVEPASVSNNQYTVDSRLLSGTLGVVDNPRRRTGRADPVAATQQASTETCFNRLGRRIDCRPLGSPVQRTVCGTQTCRHIGAGPNDPTGSIIEAGQFSFRAYRYPVRIAGLPRTLVGPMGPVTHLSPGVYPRSPRGPVAGCGRCPLAHGHPVWRDHRLAFGTWRALPAEAVHSVSDREQLAGSLTHPVRTLLPSRSGYGVSPGPTPSAWFGSPVTRSDQLAASERTSPSGRSVPNRGEHPP
jgi:4-amino-4-deoxy-L-arabinose transferase-like glycosyltransferase